MTTETICPRCGGDGGWADVEGEGEWIECPQCNRMTRVKFSSLPDMDRARYVIYGFNSVVHKEGPDWIEASVYDWLVDEAARRLGFPEMTRV